MIMKKQAKGRPALSILKKGEEFCFFQIGRRREFWTYIHEKRLLLEKKVTVRRPPVERVEQSAVRVLEKKEVQLSGKLTAVSVFRDIGPKPGVYTRH